MYFRNLLRALLALFLSDSFIVFLLNVDRLGNAICGGYYLLTVSGRVGYFARYHLNGYWRFLQWVIDTTFYPIDGRQHCYNAYQWERSSKYRRGNDIALGVLSIVVVLACIVIAPVVYIISLFKSTNSAN